MPETRYARSGDGGSIAYQVVGQGPFDVVLVPGFISHVELVWTVPSRAEMLERLATFSRLILFDKRGTGMSDRVEDAPTLETRMDDVRAVMDAAASAKAAIIGVSEGVPMSLLFAASHPERASALVLWGGMARMTWAPDYPLGWTDEKYRREAEADLGLFGTREEAERVVRITGIEDPVEVRRAADYYRRSASPGAVKALSEINREIDVRHVLPTIHVPTLVVHGTEDKSVPFAWGSYLAERIPGARFASFPAGHIPTGPVTAEIADEIERFLKAVRESGGWQETVADRVLATVLFTDIVGSTQKAAELGDSAWRELLEQHHALIRRQLVRYHGNELDTAGDGFFARFDGPERAIRCACAITDVVRHLGLEVRAGLHAGECDLMGGKVGGIAVHIGARVAKEAGPGEVLVSSTVKDLVAGSGIAFRERGTAELKGVPGEWHLFGVERPSDQRAPVRPRAMRSY
jgi:class 3 adenylate cyclase